MFDIITNNSGIWEVYYRRKKVKCTFSKLLYIKKLIAKV